MAKERCKLSEEEYKKKLEKGVDFYCEKCDRKGGKKKHLCKPKKIKSKIE
jgi:hypothetical protein